LHLSDPGGSPHLGEPELMARGLDGFTRDTPSLLESVRLRDWGTGREVWPTPSTFSVDYAQSMPVPLHAGAHWADPEVQARRHAELAAERERIARFHTQGAKEQEIRQNKEERESFWHNNVPR